MRTVILIGGLDHRRVLQVDDSADTIVMPGDPRGEAATPTPVAGGVQPAPHTYVIERIAFGRAGYVWVGRHSALTESQALESLHGIIIDSFSGVRTPLPVGVAGGRRPDWRERTLYVFPNGVVESGRACPACGATFAHCQSMERRLAKDPDTGMYANDVYCCNHCSHDVHVESAPKDAEVEPG